MPSKSVKLDPCCSSSSNMLTVEQAIDYLLSKADIKPEVEQVELKQALGRVLAEAQTSLIYVPPADNSAMDGYAVHTKDFSPGEDARLPVSQRIPAGTMGMPLAAGTAARIFTGAPVPDGADAVVMQEHCEKDGDYVVVKSMPEAGDNVRCRGEDISEGNEVLTTGQKLRPQELGLAASVGIGQLPVYRKLKIAIFSTGDELVSPGQPLKQGQIYNSNLYTLTGLIQALNCDIVDLGTVPDDLESTKKVLQEAEARADIIVTSGGVSVGEEDYVKAAIESLGSLDMWRVAMKPGKPLAFGRIGNTPFIGLPGNPVSVFVTFCLFARPFILKCQGMDNVMPNKVSVAADFDWLKPGPRREFLRAHVEMDSTGNAKAAIYPHQGSGVLSSAVWANGLVEISNERPIKSGDLVRFIPFSEMFA